MTIEGVEQAIYDQYKFYAVAAPGVTPRETLDDGTLTALGSLWALWDHMMEEAA